MSELVSLSRPSASPPWIRRRALVDDEVAAVAATVAREALPTICVRARCPNQAACWGDGTATFLLLGDTCTRACRFCHVKTAARPPVLALDEPARLARAVVALGLRHVVLTCVDRDDLDDGGAHALAAAVRAVHAARPAATVELLAPDLEGPSLDVVLAAEPDVFAHNLECVARVTPRVRDRRASYTRSLDVLRAAKARSPDVVTKSSLMVGVGEDDDELKVALADLRAAGVDIVTIGQYLRPSSRHLAVARFVSPEALARLGEAARGLGFLAVAAGPLVRSSHRAGALYDEACARIVEADRRG